MNANAKACTHTQEDTHEHVRKRKSMHANARASAHTQEHTRKRFERRRRDFAVTIANCAEASASHLEQEACSVRSGASNAQSAGIHASIFGLSVLAGWWV
eukprot:6213191-Pleurochrysis_carterae.AAC.1